MEPNKRTSLLVLAAGVVGLMAALLIDLQHGERSRTAATSLLLVGFIGLWLYRWKGGRLYQLITVAGRVGFIHLPVIRVVQQP